MIFDEGFPGVYCYCIGNHHQDGVRGTVSHWKIGKSKNVVNRIADELNETLCSLDKSSLSPDHILVMEVKKYTEAENELKRRLQTLATILGKDTLSVNSNKKKEIYCLTENEVVTHIWLPITELNSSDRQLSRLPDRNAIITDKIADISENFEERSTEKIKKGHNYDRSRGPERERIDNIIKLEEEDNLTIKDLFKPSTRMGKKTLTVLDKLKRMGEYTHTNTKGEGTLKLYGLSDFRYDLKNNYIDVGPQPTTSVQQSFQISPGIRQRGPIQVRPTTPLWDNDEQSVINAQPLENIVFF